MRRRVYWALLAKNFVLQLINWPLSRAQWPSYFGFRGPPERHRGDAAKAIRGPFKTFAEAENACEAMLVHLTR